MLWNNNFFLQFLDKLKQCNPCSKKFAEEHPREHWKPFTSHSSLPPSEQWVHLKLDYLPKYLLFFYLLIFFFCLSILLELNSFFKFVFLTLCLLSCAEISSIPSSIVSCCSLAEFYMGYPLLLDPFRIIEDIAHIAFFKLSCHQKLYGIFYIKF